MRARTTLPTCAVAVVVAMSILSSCRDDFVFTGEPGPGPDDGIVVRVATEQEYLEATYEHLGITCDGPADQVEVLGGLCFRDAPVPAFASLSAVDLNFVVRESFEAASKYAVVVFAYAESEDHWIDHAQTIRYAAYLVRDSDSDRYSDRWFARLFGRYTEGERLTGEIATLHAWFSTSGCEGGIYNGVATLQWRDTTLRFGFDVTACD